MAESSSPSDFAYRAFISYSHRDKAWADWLHKSLETYQVPSRLVGTDTAHGKIPRRLHPVFRDREELASATDLGRKVNEALGDSENLIVICSPAAATSRWVNEEVLAYKRMGRAERIFCLIVGGEPEASGMPGRETEECFCPALRFRLDASGQPTTERTEPIAADARPGKDGKANAKLKLIAGMLDVGFDALKQREQQRRVRRMTAITAMAVAIMAVTIVLAVFALISRHQAVIAQQSAERRQKQAEGLVGFMLGDLNDKLDQVHRLDIMQAVDDKAMAYFDSLPAADASDDALAMRVKALQKIGMVMTEAHGQLAKATEAYKTAETLADELARRAPANVDRQIAWADSINMVGFGDWQQGELDNAMENWQTATALLQRAHTAHPDDFKITNDLAGFQNNIGHVLESRGDFAGAQTEYAASLGLYQLLAAHDPHDLDQQSNVAWGWNNLGKLAVERGQLDKAVADYLVDYRIKAALAAQDAGNHSAMGDLSASSAILARTLAWCGDTEAGLRHTAQALAQMKALLAFDASNTGWQEYFALYQRQAGELKRQLGRFDEARDADALAVQMLTDLLKKDPISADFQQDLSQAQLGRARLQLAQNDPAAAKASVQSALALLDKLRAKAPDDRGLLLLQAQAQLLLGRVAGQQDDPVGAQRDWTQARNLLQPAVRAGNDPTFLAVYAETLLRLGQTDAAKPIISNLNGMGFRTPDFVALLAANHLDYPLNVAFRQRIVAITRDDALLAAAPVSSSTSPARKTEASARDPGKEQ